MSLKKYLDNVKFMEEARARVGLANFELPKLVAIIEAQAEALKYCSSYSNTKVGMSPAQFSGMEGALRHAVDCFEAKAKEAIAKAEKIAAGERV